MSECTQRECADDHNKDRFQCRKCERKVHYGCSDLPLYQIQAMLTSKYRRFQCVNCVTVPNELACKVRYIKRDKDINEELKQSQKKNLEQEEAILKLKSQEDTNKISDIENLLNKKFMEYKVESQQNIKKEFKLITECIAEKIKFNNKEAYAEIAKRQTPNQSEQFRSILKEERIKVIHEEHERKTRSNNIIIHGVMESSSKMDKVVEEYDKLCVRSLLDDIGRSDVKVKNVKRIGTRKESSRPIKVILTNEIEKESVLKSLFKLKNNDDYDRISITEDLTIEQRNEVKKLWEDAREKNTSDKNKNTRWRIRGNSKSGYYMKKFHYS